MDFVLEKKWNDFYVDRTGQAISVYLFFYLYFYLILAVTFVLD